MSNVHIYHYVKLQYSVHACDVKRTTSSENVGQPARPLAAAAVTAYDGAGGDAGSVTIQLRAKCEQMSHKCDLYKQEVDRLNGKLERFIHEVFTLSAVRLYVYHSFRWWCHIMFTL